MKNEKMATPKKENKAEIVKTTSASALSILSESEGSGLGDLSPDQVLVPRIKLLQSQSPQAKKMHGDYVQGAEEGDILESVSQNLYKGAEGLLMVPFSYRYIFIEWEKNEDGGGKLLENHGSKIPDCQSNGRGGYERTHPTLGIPTEIVPTFEYFIMIIDPETGDTKDALISMSKTNAKVAKRFNSMISDVRAENKEGKRVPAPMFWRTYQLTSVPQSDDRNSWAIYKVEYGQNLIDMPGGEEILEQAFNKSVQVKNMEMGAEEEAQQSATKSSKDDQPM